MDLKLNEIAGDATKSIVQKGSSGDVMKYLDKIDSVIKGFNQLADAIKSVRSGQSGVMPSTMQTAIANPDDMPIAKPVDDNFKYKQLLGHLSAYFTNQIKAGNGAKPVGALIAELPYTIEECNAMLLMVMRKLV